MDVLNDAAGVESFRALQKTDRGLLLTGGQAFGWGFEYSLEHDYSTFVASKGGREIFTISVVHGGRPEPAAVAVPTLRTCLQVLKAWASA